MIFSDQACIVLGPDGAEGGVYLAWCDAADDEARALRGRVVQLNSEPEHVFADFSDHETTADPAGHPVTECSPGRCGWPAGGEDLAEMRRATAALLRNAAGQ
jgi:hypothetical protein